jgi:AraC-like DNA-binding protein
MKIKFLLLFIGFYNLFCSQTSTKADSLESYSYPELETIFYNYKSKNNIIESKIIAQYYLQKAKTEDNKEQIAEGYVFKHFNEPLEVSLKYIDSLQFITKSSKENYYPARIYILRGNLFFKFNSMKFALNNYILALKYAKEKGNKRQIAMADISIAFLNNYIGKHAETAKTLRYYLENADYLNEAEHEQIKLNLADTYLETSKIDSANILINEGLKTFSTNKDPQRYYQYLLLSGFYHLKIKDFKIAIEKLLSCEKYFFTIDDERNRNYVLYYLGKSYAGLQQNEIAIKNFAKIDSISQKTNFIFPELPEVYTYLIEYYKEKNNKEKQLYYIEQFLKVDKVLHSQFRYISREIPRRYDTPKLLKEKEAITNELRTKKIIFYISLLVLSIILLVFIYLYYKSKKAEKLHRKIAQELIQSVHESNKLQIKNDFDKEISFEDKPKTQENAKNKNYSNISEDLSKAILNELENFETKEQFLVTGITLGSLAKKVKTNSKYLSEVINTYKGKNFAAYLNDLRIDYAINRLAMDKKFRSYKISSIAEELGYNTEQAFMLAFKKRTGTPLSIYLKEIETVLESAK